MLESGAAEGWGFGGLWRQIAPRGRWFCSDVQR